MWHLLQRLSVMTVAQSNLMYSRLGVLHRLPGESQGLGVFVKDRGLKRLGSSGGLGQGQPMATRSLEDPTEQQSLSDTWGCNQLTMSKNVSLFCCTLHQSLSLFFATCGPGHLALRISKTLRRFSFALKECIFVPCKSVGKSDTSQDEHLFSGDPVGLVFYQDLKLKFRGWEWEMWEALVRVGDGFLWRKSGRNWIPHPTSWTLCSNIFKPSRICHGIANVIIIYYCYWS